MSYSMYHYTEYSTINGNNATVPIEKNVIPRSIIFLSWKDNLQEGFSISDEQNIFLLELFYLEVQILIIFVVVDKTDEYGFFFIGIYFYVSDGVENCVFT